MNGRLAASLPLLGGAALMLALAAFRFDLQWALIRPAVLAFGRPATAVISSHYRSTGSRSSGNRIEVNYQYSPDYAPRVTMTVADDAFAAIQKGDKVPIHYLRGCSSCVAIDDDHGSARGQALTAVGVAAFALLFVWLSGRFSRPRRA